MSIDDRLHRLQRALQTLDPELSYEATLSRMAPITQDLFDAEGIAIHLRQPGGRLETIAANGSFDLFAWESKLDRDLPEDRHEWLHPGRDGDASLAPLPATVLRTGFTAGEQRGVITLAFKAPRPENREDESLLQLIACQVGLALARQMQQDRLSSEAEGARRQMRLWRALVQVGRAVMHTSDRLSLMRQICEIAVAYGHLRFAWVGENDGRGGVRPVVWAGTAGEHIRELGVRLDPADPRGGGPAAGALRDGRLTTVADVFAAPDLAVWWGYARQHGFKSVAGVPIVVGDRTEAVVVLYGGDAGEFESEQVRAVLAEMAQDLAFGLEVIEGRERRIEAEQELRLQYEIVQQAKECLVVAKVQPGGKVTFVYANPAFELMTGYHADEVVGRSSEMLWGPRTDRQRIAAMHDAVLSGESWSGEVYQYRKDGSEFLMGWSAVPMRDETGRIAYILSSHRDVTEQRAASERIAYLAHHDALTGLPNRVLLEERIAHALHKARRHRQQFAVALIDIDDFKQVNDTLGHGFGDKLLQQLAHRLERVVRSEDTIARAGGDEFILLVDTVQDRGEIDHLLGRLVRDLEQPCEIAGRTVSVAGSIGVAVFPGDGEDPETLLRHADIAMYAVKKAGEGSWCYFEPGMEQALNLRGDLREGLQQALVRGELELYYQPQVDLGRGELVGFEALLRWHDPRHGLRLPGEFLPAVEGTWLEQQIGRYVLNQALAEADLLAAQGRRLQVAFNAAPGQFLARDFPRVLGEALSRHPSVEPALVTIEVTESAAMHDLEFARRQIEACRRLGVRIALDDFGTGSSSITLLQELPCELVKIDQRFISAMLGTPESPAIIHGILIMGHAMERRVLAEGVETRAQAQALLRLGCQLAQGYAIARPMPADRIDAYIEEFGVALADLFGTASEAASESFQRLAAGLGHLRWTALFTATAAHGTLQPYGGPSGGEGACCGLGYWIETYGRRHFDGTAAIAEVERLHAQAHQIAAEVRRLHDLGQSERAGRLAEELWQQKDGLIMAIAGLKDEPGATA